MIDHFWVQPKRLGGGAHPARSGDLSGSLKLLKRLGFDALITLTGEPLDPGALGSAGQMGLHLPVVESAVPTLTQLAAASKMVTDCNAAEKAVFVHCFGGRGRAGVVLAAILIGQGQDCQTAIDRVRKVRPGAIESRQQEEFLRSLAAG